MKNHQLQNMAGRSGHIPVLDDAMAWLRHQRRNAPVHADVWHLRHHWERIAPVLQQQLQSGTYQLTPMQVVGLDRNAMWSAQDALVLKWVALQVTPLLPVHARCEHVKGHGGGRASIARLSTALQSGEYRYVCRTDIKGYYGAITKKTVMAQVRRYVADPVLLGLIDQYVHYTVEQGGEFYTPERGICRGCPLSPLIGAMHLYEVDAHFAREQETRGIVYARYMDDFIILAKSRWQLRGQVKALNGYLQAYGFIQHPDKTFIGRLEKGFDWMGAWLGTEGVEDIAPRALANHREKVRRLYERLRMWPRARAHARVSQYRSRWKIWACAFPAVAPLVVHAGNFLTYGEVRLSPCTPSAVFSWYATGTTPPLQSSNNGYSLVGSGGVEYLGSWAGAPAPYGGLLSEGPYGDRLSSCPNFGGTGVLSSDGHALLFWDSVLKPVGGFTGRAADNTQPIDGVESTAGHLSFDVSKGSIGNLIYDSGPYVRPKMIYAWPSYVQGGPFARSGTFTRYNYQGTLYIIWDGKGAGGSQGSDLSYSLPAGAFTSSDYFTVPGDPQWVNPSPAVTVTVVAERPSCHLLIDGVSQSSLSVPLGEFDPACGSHGCPAKTMPANGAQTRVSVMCTASVQPSSTQAVTPYVDVVGSVDSSRSNWLLKTSMGNAVTIWGTTVAGDNFGCNYKGWIDGTDTWHGGVPFAAGKVWVPFPNDGPSYGSDSPWGSTAGGWNGQTWQSKVATIQWGACVDPSAGDLLAGSFSASATFALRIP